MPSDVRPYKVPRAGTVALEPWQLLDGDWVPLPPEFEGWDSGTDLLIRRTTRIDIARFRHETGLDPRYVSLTVSWRSSTTGMKESAAPMRVPGNGLGVFEARLPAERLAGTIQIRTTLCLVSEPDEQQPGVARIPGSVLHQDSYEVVLDRGDQRFPVGAIDFAATRLPADASWHLETSTDLAAPFFGTYRVLVNTRDTELAQAVERGARDRRQQALLDELESGIAGLLLEMAVLLHDELRERPEWPVGSIGDVLCRTLSSSRVQITRPPTPTDLAVFRTQLAAAVRTGGKGRLFR